jgi:Peptidase A4 family
MLKFSDGMPKKREVRLVLRIALAVSAVLAVGAPSAFADSVQSSNWAGYAVHRSGVRFKKVVAAWKQPRVDCAQYSPGYSAVWVGLGGFSASSEALEQIGTESDCTGAGRAVSSAWYELVPAPSRGVNMRVSPGDTMFASVTVSGQQATLVLEDQTRHTTFRKTLRVSPIDLSSAEWIVEAPSECVSADVCRTLPLADFGSTKFALAGTQTTSGQSGPITDRSWDTTKINLSPSGRRFVLAGGGPTDGAASPSGLSSGGSSFKVTFQSASIQASRIVRAAAAAVPGGYIMHAARG